VRAAEDNPTNKTLESNNVELGSVVVLSQYHDFCRPHPTSYVSRVIVVPHSRCGSGSRPQYCSIPTMDFHLAVMALVAKESMIVILPTSCDGVYGTIIGT
jgi:hypothetical protein